MSRTKTTGKDWSWSRLVREHGEEQALALLQYQTGLGEYDADHTAKPVDVPYEPPQAALAFRWSRGSGILPMHESPPWLLRKAG